MRHRYTCVAVVTLTGLACLLLVGGAALAAKNGGEAAKPKAAAGGIELYVSARWLPLHDRPKGYAAVKGMLSFGTPVRLKGMAKTDGESAASKKDDSWAFVEADGKQGYVPVASLVSAEVLDRQDPSRAMRKVEARDVTASGKGFSESEEGDLKAMKGVAGKASAGAADEAGVDAILAAPQQYDPRTAYEAFRKEGALGEFQEKW